MVALTAVTREGRRYPVFGRIGTTLAEALAGSTNPEVSGATAVLSPRHGAEAHVRVAHEFVGRLPPLDDDARDALESAADEVAPDSRLASTVRAHAAARARLRAEGRTGAGGRLVQGARVSQRALRSAAHRRPRVALARCRRCCHSFGSEPRTHARSGRRTRAAVYFSLR
jgi:hypothetical protein